MVEVADTEERVVSEGEESNSTTDDEIEQHEVEVRRPQSPESTPRTLLAELQPVPVSSKYRHLHGGWPQLTNSSRDNSC